MKAIRNNTSKMECTLCVPFVAHQKANAAGKNVCNGFVSSFGTYLGWTLLRHRSSQAEWSRRPVLRGQASRSVKSLNENQTNMSTLIETSVGAPENGAPTNSEVSPQNGTADQIGSQPANNTSDTNPTTIMEIQNGSSENPGNQTGADQDPSDDEFLTIENPPSIAPEGLQLGRFTKALIFVIKAKEKQKEKQKEKRGLMVSVELVEKDDKGNPFALSRPYNLDGHGRTTFKEEVHAWRGQPLSSEELRKFNPTQILVNKPVMVEIVHRKVGNKSVAQITSFKPVPAPAMASR
jgi:hypothetical protein